MKIGIIVLFFFILSTLVSAELTREQQVNSELMNLAMPISEPKINSGTVSIEYDMSTLAKNITFPNQAMYALGALARYYPGSNSVEVVGVAGGKKIVSVKAATKDVIDYGEMQVWEEEFQKKIIVTDYTSNCGTGKVLVNGNCVQAEKQAQSQATNSQNSAAAQEGEQQVIEVDPMWLLVGGVLLLLGFGFIAVLVIAFFLIRKKRKK
jgi:hypothetical protein